MCVGLRFHVVIGVGRFIVRFHHAYAIPEFLLDVVVRLCRVIIISDSCTRFITKRMNSQKPSSEVYKTSPRSFPRLSLPLFETF